MEADVLPVDAQATKSNPRSRATLNADQAAVASYINPGISGDFHPLSNRRARAG